MLSGSRARGDANPASDYDVAVFLDDVPDRLAELNRLADLSVMFLDETGAFFDAKPYPSTSYSKSHSTYVRNEILCQSGLAGYYEEAILAI